MKFLNVIPKSSAFLRPLGWWQSAVPLKLNFQPLLYYLECRSHLAASSLQVSDRAFAVFTLGTPITPAVQKSHSQLIHEVVAPMTSQIHPNKSNQQDPKSVSCIAPGMCDTHIPRIKAQRFLNRRKVRFVAKWDNKRLFRTGEKKRRGIKMYLGPGGGGTCL